MIPMYKIFSDHHQTLYCEKCTLQFFKQQCPCRSSNLCRHSHVHILRSDWGSRANVKPRLLTLSQNQEVIQPIWSYGPHRQLIHPIGSWCKPLVGWGSSSPDGQWKQPRRIDDPPLAKAPHHLPELGQTEPRSGTTSGCVS